MERQGDWMQTYTGRMFWPIDPRPEDVCIEDIVHALSMMRRYNGHCKKFYSVAEHSVIMSYHVSTNDALWALLHDASEAYIADIVRPAKRFISGYKEVETRIMHVVCDAFRLQYDMPEGVHVADNAILSDEMNQIMGPKPQDWALSYPPLGCKIEGWSPKKAERKFIQRFNSLYHA